MKKKVAGPLDLTTMWSADQVAEYLGIARILVYQWVQRHKLTPIKVGRASLFEKKAVRALKRELAKEKN